MANSGTDTTTTPAPVADHECDGLHDAEDLRALGQVGTAAAHMVLTEGSHYLDVLTHDATQAREYARHELVLPDLSQALTTAAGYQAITGTYRASDTAIRVPGSTGPDGDWQFKPLPYPGM